MEPAAVPSYKPMETTAKPDQADLVAGIIGLGLAGGIMAGVIRDCPGVRLGGAAELDPDLRARFEAGEGVPAYAAIDDLLEVQDIDFIYVATPHQFHRDHVVRAAQAGKHIIVEKPMALSLEDCDAMIAAADAAGVHLIVGHTHSFDPAVLAMRELIDAGDVGPLRMLSMWNYTDFLYRPRRPEELDTAQGGGVLYNQLPHQIDIARLLVGAPIRSIRASTFRLDPARPTEGACSVFVDFANGAAATISYSGYDRFDSDELCGWVSEGGYAKQAAHGRTRQRLGTVQSPAEEMARRRSDFGYGSAVSASWPPHQPHFGAFVASCEHADLRQSPAGVLVYDDSGVREHPVCAKPWRPGRGDVLKEMRLAIREGRRPLHDGAFGRGTVAASLAVLRSAQERREIILDQEGLA